MSHVYATQHTAYSCVLLCELYRGLCRRLQMVLFTQLYVEGFARTVARPVACFFAQLKHSSELTARR